jgi:ribosomal protein S27E
MNRTEIEIKIRDLNIEFEKLKKEYREKLKDVDSRITDIQNKCEHVDTIVVYDLEGLTIDCAICGKNLKS